MRDRQHAPNVQRQGKATLRTDYTRAQLIKEYQKKLPVESNSGQPLQWHRKSTVSDPHHYRLPPETANHELGWKGTLWDPLPL